MNIKIDTDIKIYGIITDTFAAVMSVSQKLRKLYRFCDFPFEA
jgi:hypothetical protein